LAKVGVEKAELHNARQGAGSARSSEGAVRTAENCRTVPSVTSVSSAYGIPKLLGEFAGLTKQAAVDRILSTVCDWQPVGNKTRRELRDAEIWALWRFTSHSVRKIAKIARLKADKVDRAIRRVRALRLKERAWWRSIWNAEWSLRWSLAAAPWRE